MRVDDYTADNICKVMLGEPFDPGPRADTLVRVVLKPSFHPEVVLSSRESTGHATWVVDAFVEQFWLQASPPSVFASSSGRATLAGDVATRITELLAAVDGEGAVGDLVLDGMGFDMVIRQRDTASHRTGCVTVDRRVRTFLRELVPAVHARVRHAGLRRALGQVGTYLDLDVEIPPPPELKRIAVLGRDDDRHELLRALRSADHEDN